MSAGRSCGSCTLCCKLFPIDWPTDPPVGKPALKKEAGVLCEHCAAGKGCGIYEDRPISCAGYQCLWLMGFVPEAFKPDVIGGFFDLHDRYVVLWREPGKDPIEDVPGVAEWHSEFAQKRGLECEVF